MSNKFLTDPERLELLKKYQDENLREAPANILDKTLIDNYGNDEQKARLASPETGKEPKGGADETGDKNETGDAGSGTNSDEMKASDNDETKKFTKEFNRYVKLFGKAPDASIKDSETIRNLSDKKEDEDAKKGTDEDPENAPTNSKGLDLIRLKHKETGEVIYPSVFSYENYIKKTQPEYEPDAVKPKEIKTKGDGQSKK